jgi:hypothetical protein
MIQVLVTRASCCPWPTAGSRDTIVVVDCAAGALLVAVHVHCTDATLPRHFMKRYVYLCCSLF